MQKHTWKTLTGISRLEGTWLRRTHFHDAALAQITEHIRQSETQHSGELMVAIEAIMPPHESDSRLRALEVFGRLHTWDTPLNTGVLLYLALDKGRIEIVADRGINAAPETWQTVCQALQQRLAAGDYLSGVLEAIAAIETILLSSCPPLSDADEHPNQLPDDPVLL